MGEYRDTVTRNAVHSGVSARLLGRVAPPLLVNRAVGVRRGLWLIANLVWLVLFGIVAFRVNEAALLIGLDGAYVANVVEQQARWAPVAIGLTSNFLQSLGNVWFPINAALVPSYAISLWLGGGTLDPIATYVFFSVELFVAAWLVAWWIGYGATVAAVAGWLVTLSAVPYLGLPKVYGILVTGDRGDRAIRYHATDKCKHGFGRGRLRRGPRPGSYETSRRMR